MPKTDEHLWVHATIERITGYQVIQLEVKDYQEKIVMPFNKNIQNQRIYIWFDIHEQTSLCIQTWYPRVETWRDNVIISPWLLKCVHALISLKDFVKLHILT